MQVKRKIIEIDEERCDGCGNCIPSCAEGAIQIIDGKARVVKDQYCDGLGACLGDCPQDALKLVEREADEFDEKAVEEYLKTLEKNKKSDEADELQSHVYAKAADKDSSTTSTTSTLACGCPSTHLQTFPVAAAHGEIKPHQHPPGDIRTCADANKPSNLKGSSSVSALGHWPVQIRLIPPTAPFLKGADLLITADCVPVAYPAFHDDFLKGKVVMLGCPKFDDVESYIDKFAQIFQIAGIKSITALIMEVPCCSSLPVILKKAMEKCGVGIPIKQIIISARGEIVR